MDLGKAFSYQFEDDEWVKKILVAGLINLIPIFGQVYLFGWLLNVMKRVQEDYPAPLPDDFDLGGNFVRGLKGAVVGLVYSIPIFIAYIPVIIAIVLMNSSNGDLSEALGIFGVLSAICCGGLAFIFVILIYLGSPAIYGLLNENESIGDAFKFGEVFNLVKSSFGTYLLAFLGAFLATLIGSLGFAICLIGAIFTIPYCYSIIAHLYAQVYKKSLAEKTL